MFMGIHPCPVKAVFDELEGIDIDEGWTQKGFEECSDSLDQSVTKRNKEENIKRQIKYVLVFLRSYLIIINYEMNLWDQNFAVSSNSIKP